jgi:hypothetical protein
MANTSPATALSSCESALRQLLTYVLAEKYGAAWMSAIFSGDKLVTLTNRQAEEAKKRTTRGVAVIPESLLDYSNFYELINLAEKHWDLVSPALGKKSVTGALLHRFDDLRNSVAHSRDLLPFEEDLLSGIAGEIRNRVTIFMSTQAPSGEHFPRAERITDSFGNAADVEAMLRISNPPVQCQQVLHIGDEIGFRCRGWDPHGRPLTWRLRLHPASSPVITEATGDEVELSWTVDASNVSNLTYAIVDFKSDGPYHRWSEGVDGMVLFSYRVEPPALLKTS